MKKLLLTISLILCISVLLLSLASCKAFDPLSKLEGFTICNNDISKYKIVYASPAPEAVKWENYYFGIDYKFDEMSANELKTQIQSIFGTELDVVCDADTEPSEYEILIGKTNREVSAEHGLDTLTTNTGKCFVADTKLILCGGSYSSTYHSIDLLISEFKNQAQNGLKTVSLTSSFVYEKVFTQKNIALIGDEIFKSSRTTDADELSVPCVLQRLLWKDYNVSSYLEGDSTVRSDLNKGVRYISTDSYKNLLHNCTKLDAVIINLGTFDQYYNENEWDKTDDAMFLSCYKNIIEELISINPDLKLYICTTVSAKNDQGITDAQKSIYKALSDLDYNVTLIELDSLMGEYIFEESFTDEIYPNEFASAIIAKKIATEFSKNGD